MLNYYTNPPPAYGRNWRAARVPGWGANPGIVGPRMIGVGAIIGPKPRLASSGGCQWACGLAAQCDLGVITNQTMCATARQNAASCSCSSADMTSKGAEDVVQGAGSGSFPWIYVGAGALMLAAATLFAYKRGLLKF